MKVETETKIKIEKKMMISLAGLFVTNLTWAKTRFIYNKEGFQKDMWKNHIHMTANRPLANHKLF